MEVKISPITKNAKYTIVSKLSKQPFSSFANNGDIFVKCLSLVPGFYGIISFSYVGPEDHETWTYDVLS